MNPTEKTLNMVFHPETNSNKHFVEISNHPQIQVKSLSIPKMYNLELNFHFSPNKTTITKYYKIIYPVLSPESNTPCNFCNNYTFQTLK